MSLKIILNTANWKFFWKTLGYLLALVYGNIFPFKILRLKYIVIRFHYFVLFLILKAINIGDIRRGIF